MNPSQDTMPAEASPAQASAYIDAGAPVFDVRPPAEQAGGKVPGAQTMDPENPVSSVTGQGLCQDDALLVCCGTGVRSARAVVLLREAGFGGATGIRGGFSAWRDAGLPCSFPDNWPESSLQRYARHLALPEIGLAGQEQLRRSRVLLLGAGGLGSPAALYLAAAGIGSLGLVDDDRVERSNLQRQILHTDSAVGQAKTESASERISALNPEVSITQYPRRLAADNAQELLEGWDLVVDGADNLASKYLLNEACVQNGLPMVYGAVSGFNGQLSVFHPAAGDYPCYRCGFPAAPAAGVEDCSTAGVLGVVPGLVGVLQAAEAIKYLLGIGKPLLGRLLMVDVLAMSFHTIGIARRPDCPVCSNA